MEEKKELRMGLLVFEMIVESIQISFNGVSMFCNHLLLWNRVRCQSIELQNIVEVSLYSDSLARTFYVQVYIYDDIYNSR